MISRDDVIYAYRLLLDALGHREWIAQSEADYVDKVVALARDVEHRKALRLIRRSHMAQSPLCDAKGLARSLEAAFEAMFGRWLSMRDPSHHAAAK